MREPTRLVSSCTAATAATSPGAPPASATRRATSNATKAPMRLSIARETTRSLGSSIGSPAITATSPTRVRRARLVAVSGADVDVQVLQLRDVLAVVGLHQVDRLLADHAVELAALRRQLDALADEDDRVPAADALEAQEAVVVDVRDDHADLVDVADDRGQRTAGRPSHARDRGADHVGADVGERLRRRRARPSRRGLVARTGRASSAACGGSRASACRGA